MYDPLSNELNIVGPQRKIFPTKPKLQKNGSISTSIRLNPKKKKNIPNARDIPDMNKTTRKLVVSKCDHTNSAGSSGIIHADRGTGSCAYEKGKCRFCWGMDGGGRRDPIPGEESKAKSQPMPTPPRDEYICIERATNNTHAFPHNEITLLLRRQGTSGGGRSGEGEKFQS